jgi:hypothetical protein
MNEKPMRGEFLIERRERSAARSAAEDAVMQAALKRDNRKCRNPRCTFKGRQLPVDPCHAFRHRGMGGNPKLDRTASTDLIISLCRGCHGLLDAGKLEIEPQTPEWCDGLVAFHAPNRDGRMIRIATEVQFGIARRR